MGGIKVGCFGENCKENQLDSWQLDCWTVGSWTVQSGETTNRRAGDMPYDSRQIPAFAGMTR
jgi:hypothetical protein